MNTLLSNIIKINELQVVGVVRQHESEIFHVLAVKKKRSKIAILSSVTYESFESLVKNINVRIPVIVAVDGKGILNKAVDFNLEADTNWYKNIDFETIYHTTIIGENRRFVSFCRKNLVEELLVRFKAKGLQVADVYVGSLLSYLLRGSIKTEKILSADMVLEFSSEKLQHIAKQPTGFAPAEYQIGEDLISSDFLPLYGIVIQFFVKTNEVTNTTNEGLQLEEIIYRKAFNIFGTSLLVFFLLALMSSYGLIQYYGSKNAALNLQNVYHNETYQKGIELEKQRENKQRIASESGILSSKFLTFYAYEIIKTIPYDISLNGLDITPLIEEAKPGKKIIFKAKTIVVSGETFNESSFNRWLEALKKTSWIGNFEIVKLKKDKKNKSQFEIIITVKDV